MDTGKQLISRIVDDGRIKEVEKSGIEADFFTDEHRALFNYILRHSAEYQKVPSRDVIIRAFPNFEFSDAPEPLEYYINELKEDRRREILEDKLKKAARVYQKDTKQAEEYVRDCLSSLQITGKSFKDISLGGSRDEILEEYEAKKLNPGIDGIRSGWNSLDNQTLGWHPGEFVVLAGEKYMGKSWLMIDLALKAALQGERVCFITREMAQTQVRRRAASLIGHVPFESLRKGVLTNSEEERFKTSISKLNENFQFHIAQNGVYTIDDMQRKAIETDATILFTDSVYLFQPDKRGRDIGEVQKRLAISQKCKLVSQELKIPFIVSVQAGRRATRKVEAPNLDNIEWSNAFSQDGDHVFFIQKDDIDKELRRAQIWLLKVRDGLETDFFIHQDFEYMDFSERADKRAPTTQVFEEGEDTVFS